MGKLKDVHFVYVLHEGVPYIVFPDGIPPGHAIKVADVIESIVKTNDQIQDSLRDIEIGDDE